MLHFASMTMAPLAVFRGAPDLDPDPAGYPVGSGYQDPVGSGSGRIQKY